MNLPVILLVGLLTVPSLGYMTYQTLDGPSVLPAHGGASGTSSKEATHEHHRGVQTIDLGIAAPWPTCPLQCRMGYSWGNGGLEFEVPEGATRIEVRAEWEAAVPTARTLDVWLVTPDAECGDGCWMAVDSAEGAGRVLFVHDEPVPGSYRISAYGAGPAYVIAKQDVRLDAYVHFS